MAWEKVRAHRKLSTNGVRLALRKIASNERLKLVITLGPDVLKVTCWETGTEIEVFRGTAQDVGKLRLSKGREEAYRLRLFAGGSEAKNKDKLTIAAWSYDGLPTTKQNVTECTWRYADDALIIDLPEWAKPKVLGFQDNTTVARQAGRAAR